MRSNIMQDDESRVHETANAYITNLNFAPFKQAINLENTVLRS
jgi:hypothetical protein